MGSFVGAGTFNTVINANMVRDIKPGDGGGSDPYHPAYGITITRDPARDTSDAPISKRNQITNNYVIGVPSWNGIDLHGAQETLIADNFTYLCSIGIHLEDGNGGGSLVPVIRAKIIGNTCIGNTGTSFVEAPGINLKGAADTSANFQRSINVTGNTVINHGYDTAGVYSARHGAIHALRVEGLVISDNDIDAPQGVGIYLDDVEAGAIKNNTIYSVQTSNSDTYGIYLADGDFTGVIEGNVFFGASPQINIASASGTGGPDATYSIKTINNMHHGTATKFENIELLHAWDEDHTTTQQNAINNPPNGMTINNTTTNAKRAYINGAWVDLS